LGWSRQAAECGDNTPGLERIRGATSRREGRTDVIGRDWLLTQAGYGILLLAMAIQGLTPDYRNLASSWLLRFVTSISADVPLADGDPSPMPAPLQSEGGPCEICRMVTAETALRIRSDDGNRLCISFLIATLLERPIRSAPRSRRLLGVIPPRSDGLVPSLCRFQC
jgi:hypothetical protein